MKHIETILISVLTTLLAFCSSNTLAQLSRTISYQGVLSNADGSTIPDGAYDIIFSLYDEESGGSPIWTEAQPVTVVNGIFNAIMGSVNSLDLPFEQPYWLGMTVNAGEELSPRIPLTASPYSFHAFTVSDSSITAEKIASNQIVRSINDITDAVILRAVGGATISANGDTIIINAGSGNGLSGWSLTGNAGTDASENFIGTTDDEPFEVRANGQRVLRFEPGPLGHPNIVGGFAQNSTTAGVQGATISGGGWDDQPNLVTDEFGTVGGGWGNQAGNGDEISTNAGGATVSGGFQNQATASVATIGGGTGNTASVQGSTVAGGWQNGASGRVSAIGGGEINTASGQSSTIGGGNANAAEGLESTIGGGHFNMATGWGSTVAGGDQNRVLGQHSTIGGGHQNLVTGAFAAVGGGQRNRARGDYSVVLGGGGPIVSLDTSSALGQYSVVAGGRRNLAAGDYSFAAGRKAKAAHAGAFVWADATDADFASTNQNQFLVRASGGVGIGTTDPQGALLILNAVEPPTGLAPANNGLMLGIQATAGYKWIQSYGGALILNPRSNNVGIGTTTAGNILTVVQNSASDPIADAWTTYSSRRWKTNIQTMAGALNKVSQLRGVSYDWKKDGKHDIGLIAEEVGAVIPEVVAYEENGLEAKSVDYARLVALLIEGMKEQQKQIEELREVIQRHHREAVDEVGQR